LPVYEDAGLIRDADISYKGASKFIHFYNELFRENNMLLKHKLA